MEKKKIQILIILMLFVNLVFPATPTNGVAYKNYNAFDGSTSYSSFSNDGTYCVYLDQNAKWNVTINYGAVFYVYNVTNITDIMDIKGSNYFIYNQVYVPYVYSTTIGEREYVYNNGSSGWFEFYFDKNSTVNFNLTSGGKTNYFNFTADFNLPKNLTKNDIIVLKWLCKDTSTTFMYGGSETGVSLTSGAGVKINFMYEIKKYGESYSPIAYGFDMKALTPHNLNQLVYVKNSNNNTVAIYVVYEGKEYMLTANTFANYDVFYSDTALLHRIQCGENGKINLSSGKRNVLILSTGGNLILDADSACSALANQNAIQDRNETKTKVEDILKGGRICGYFQKEEDNNTINVTVNFSDSSVNSTYNVVVLYSNGSQYNYIYAGDFNISLNKSDVDMASFICVKDRTTVSIFYGETDKYENIVIYKYIKDFGTPLGIIDLEEVNWVIFFLGVIPAIFLFGRNHLSMLIGMNVLILFLVLFNILPSIWLVIILVTILIVTINERRII